MLIRFLCAAAVSPRARRSFTSSPRRYASRTADADDTTRHRRRIQPGGSGRCADAEKEPAHGEREDRLEAGKAIFKSKCSKCHGPGGLGDGPDADPDATEMDLTNPKRAGRNPDGVVLQGSERQGTPEDAIVQGRIDRRADLDRRRLRAVDPQEAVNSPAAVCSSLGRLSGRRARDQEAISENACHAVSVRPGGHIR